MRVTTQNKYEQAQAEYILNELSLIKICKKYAISRGKFNQFLKKNNVEIINYQNIDKFDNTVFNIINTEEKAYWLGFLFADGSVSSESNSIELGLQLRDYEHLKKYRDFLKCSLPVIRDSYRCRLTVTNKYFKAALIALGCTPKKSLTLKFPSIDEPFVNHFIRGYVDGDGCFMLGKTNLLLFSLIGTSEFLTSVGKYFGFYGKQHKDLRHLGNTYSIQFSGVNAQHVAKYLYKDATIYLERKYEKVKNCRLI